MTRTVNGLMALALGLMLGAGPAAAAVIETVRIEQRGMGRTDEAYVQAHIQADVGEPFEGTVAARDVKRLLETGMFSFVDVRVAETETGGLDVVYTVEPKHRLVAPPEIEGVTVFREGKVRDWLELEEGAPVDDQAAGVALQKVIREYRRKMYNDARGDWAFETVDASRGLVRLAFRIEEGEPSFLKRIRVSGNASVPEKQLRDALQRPSPWNPWRWVFRKRYPRQALDEIEAAVRREYLNRGFMDVAVKVEPDAATAGAGARVTVLEGERFAFGEVALEGIEVFPEAELQPLLAGVRPGRLASLDAIEDTARRLQQYYGDRGYLNAGARPVLVPDREQRRLDVRFRVREGERVRIRNIVIRGNTRTRDKVIRRELLVYPGDVYNQTRVQRSERRLSNLGFFDMVRVLPEATAQPAERDLVFDVTEKRTGQFMIGAGFSSVDKLIGFMELSQGNFDLLGWPYFTGGGQKLRLRAQFGSSREDYELSFTEPWFLNRRLSLGFDLYRRERSYSEYDLKRTGAAIRFGRALPLASRLNLLYEIERTEISDVADTNLYYRLDSYDFETGTGDPYSFISEEDQGKSALTVNLVQDTRNNPFVPTRGSRFVLSYTVAGGPLGFDMDYYNLGLQTTTYIPLWFGHVFNVRSRVEFIEAFGDTEEVPLSERLFLGGGRTLRGFKYRDVGPKVIRPIEGTDRFYDRPYGGQSLFMANAEYTVPILPGVRIGFFYDTGNVWSEHYKVDLTDLASSTGLGLRLDVPGFPIRIDRAWVLETDDAFTAEDNWVIWIGYDY